jgi:hypothetical protein
MVSSDELQQFVHRFPDEAACLRFLVKTRWPMGVASPFTGGPAYEIKTRPGLFKCRDTRQQFSVKRGSIFEESRIPVRKWFFLIFLLTSVRSALRSTKLACRLGVTPKTALFMMKRLREAVVSAAFEHGEEIQMGGVA